jgi:hypothetical protein
MVVLLRTLGVPARLAVGFAVPHNDSSEDVHHVFGNNAYAWPEVYFTGLGWIPFSPSRAYDTTNAPMSPADTWDTYPTDTVSTQDLLDMFPAAGSDNAVAPEEQSAVPPTDESAGSPISPWLAVPLLLIATLALTSVAGLRYAWSRGLSGLSHPAQLFEKTRRLSSWAGVGPRPSQTPREFLGGLRDKLSEPPDVSVLAEAYERVEFGQKCLAPDEDAKLEALWKRLRPSLLKRMLRRGGRP